MQRCSGTALARHCFKPGSWQQATGPRPATAAPHPLAAVCGVRSGAAPPPSAASAAAAAQAALQRPRQLVHSMASAPGAAAASTAALPSQPLPLVLVVAVVLLDGEGRVLLAQRPPGKKLAGLWEFPGGKVDAGEGPEVALARELQEELGIAVEPAALHPLTFASHAYDSFHLLMPTYTCAQWEGQPTGAEGQALAWVTAAELEAGRYEMPPADIPLLLPVLAAMRQHAGQRSAAGA